jgi:hypothetical protein
VRRRHLLVGFASAALAWPAIGWAQQSEQRRIGVLMTRMIRKVGPASLRSCEAFSNWAGPMAVTCRLTLAGLGVMRSISRNRRLNWPHKGRT